MHKFILPLLASLALAAPAHADTRVEARGGVFGADGTGEPIVGAAAGIDFAVAPVVFAGVEVSADRVDDGGALTMVGLSGRFGAALPSGTRVFVTGGYSTKYCNTCQDRWHAGGGVQQSVAGPVYIKAEYRHYFPGSLTVATDAVFAGVGVSF